LNLAENKHLRGQTEKAATLAQQVLPILRAGHDRHTLGLVLANLCGYLVALGRLSHVPAVAREALETVPNTIATECRLRTRSSIQLSLSHLTETFDAALCWRVTRKPPSVVLVPARIHRTNNPHLSRSAPPGTALTHRTQRVARAGGGTLTRRCDHPRTFAS
jgi:hypothetical protein